MKALRVLAPLLDFPAKKRKEELRMTTSYTQNMATNEGRKVRIQTKVRNSPKPVAITTVANEFDSLGPRYRLRDLLSSDKGEDKER